MAARTSEDRAIAIVGGGVSGLVLARELAGLGFSRITVFERAAEVGGKSCTVDIDGRAHDLGATMGVPIDYRHVTAVSDEAGIATDPFPREEHYCLEAGAPRPLNRRRELPRVALEAARYLALHATRWRVDNALHAAPPELYAPWAEIEARHGLAAASRRTLCYRAGYGYGFDDDTPAVLYANLLRPQTFRGLAGAGAFVWRGGTQPVWTALAARLEAGGRVEIRRATRVTKIERDGHGVTVHSEHGDARAVHVDRFDRLVIACNPRDLLGALDASPAEHGWFSQIRTTPYATFACEVDGLAAGRASIGYLDGNMRRDRAGHPMAWVKRYADHGIHVFHLYAPDALSDAAIADRIASDVARLGGRFVRVREARRWSFFPHFGSAFMRAGGLSEIEAWQGQRQTYVVGEVLSFATMARCAEHAVASAHRIARERGSAVTTIAAAPRLAS